MTEQEMFVINLLAQLGGSAEAGEQHSQSNGCSCHERFKFIATIMNAGLTHVRSGEFKTRQEKQGGEKQ